MGVEDAVEEERSREVALALLEAALEPPDEDEEGGPEEVRKEDQMSLSVGIVGAPNAGKSSLTNTAVRFLSAPFLCISFMNIVNIRSCDMRLDRAIVLLIVHGRNMSNRLVLRGEIISKLMHRSKLIACI